MKRFSIFVFIAAALMYPVFYRDYWLYVAIIGLFYAILSSSWAMLAGQVGRLGTLYVLSLKVIDPAEAKVLRFFPSAQTATGGVLQTLGVPAQ